MTDFTNERKSLSFQNSRKRLLHRLCLMVIILVASPCTPAYPQAGSSTGFAGAAQEQKAFVRKHILGGLKNSAFAIALSPDKKFLVAGGANKKITMWRTSDWSVVAANAKDPKGKIFGLCFSRDGKYVVCCGEGESIMSLDAKTLKPVKEMKTSEQKPHRLTTAPSLGKNKMLAVGETGVVFVFDPARGMSKARKIHKTIANGILDDGKKFYSSGDVKRSTGTKYELKSHTLDRADAKQILELPERAMRLNFGRDKNEILIPMMTQVAVVDVRSRKVKQTWKINDTERMGDFVYWPEQDLYIASNYKGIVALFRMGQSKPIAKFKCSDSACFQITPLSDKLFATASKRLNTPVVIWEADLDKLKLKPSKLAGGTSSKSNSNNSTASKAPLVEFVMERELKPFNRGVITLALSAGKSLLAVGGYAKDIAIYQTRDWKKIADNKDLDGIALDMAFNGDGSKLVAVGLNKDVLIMDGRNLETLSQTTLDFVPRRATYRTKPGTDQFKISGISNEIYTADLQGGRNGSSKTPLRNIGAICSDCDGTIYAAGLSTEGANRALYKVTSSYQRLVCSFPEGITRLRLAKCEQELVLSRQKSAAIVDLKTKSIKHVFRAKEEIRVEDALYWAERDLYLTLEKFGTLRVWKAGHSDPVATAKVSDGETYQMQVLDKDRILIVSTKGKEQVRIWKAKFDLMGIASLSNTNLANGESTGSINATSSPKWVEIDSKLEVKKIDLAKLAGVEGYPLTENAHNHAQRVWPRGKRIPPHIQANFRTPSILDACLLNEDTLLATNGPMLTESNGKWTAFEDTRTSKHLYARCFAKHPNGGVLIGGRNNGEVYWMSADGKLMRMQTINAPASSGIRQEDISIHQLTLSHGMILAATNAGVFELANHRGNLQQGNWVQVMPAGFKLIANMENRNVLAMKDWLFGERSLTLFNVGQKQQANIPFANARPDSPLHKADQIYIRKIFPASTDSVFCVLEYIEDANRPVNSVGFSRLNLNQRKFYDFETIRIPESVRAGRNPVIIDIELSPNGDIWFASHHGIGVQPKRGGIQYHSLSSARSPAQTGLKVIDSENVMLFGLNQNGSTNVQHVRKK